MVDELTPEQRNEFWAMGDANRDGYINEFDSQLFADAFGCFEGETCYDARCDINKDGLVDMRDSAICSKYQGLNIWDYFGVEPPPSPESEWMNIAYSAGIGCLIGIIYLIIK